MFNPYQMQQNPYLDRLSQMTSTQPFQVTTVNGENGARAFNMPPNSSILLLDEALPILWIKKTDGAGYATIQAYNLTPYEDKTQADTKSLEARITRLEEILNGKSDSSEPKSKPKHTQDTGK